MGWILFTHSFFHTFPILFHNYFVLGIGLYILNIKQVRHCSQCSLISNGKISTCLVNNFIVINAVKKKL